MTFQIIIQKTFIHVNLQRLRICDNFANAIQILLKI